MGFPRRFSFSSSPGTVLGRGGSSAGRRYFYPEGGFGALAEGLMLERGRVMAVGVAGRELAAESVVATVPLPLLCGWVGRHEAAERLGFRALTQRVRWRTLPIGSERTVRP
ncbi:hypothetical protein JQX13_43230 [Archangium violaceum]|uniref:hypothetical protein n=1 Tax=Archangium violaceum TaxID=83451 RepID=UPI00193B0985|nr:hypothetical protein [Archangium violaceum]QRK06809.1 hypothetical protein JQX13_43230 [Archangium violaceum]